MGANVPKRRPPHLLETQLMAACVLNVCSMGHGCVLRISFLFCFFFVLLFHYYYFITSHFGD